MDGGGNQHTEGESTILRTGLRVPGVEAQTCWKAVKQSEHLVQIPVSPDHSGVRRAFFSADEDTIPATGTDGLSDITLVDGHPAIDFVPRFAAVSRNCNKSGVPAGSKSEPLP